MLRIDGDEVLLVTTAVEDDADGWARDLARRAAVEGAAAVPGARTSSALRVVHDTLDGAMLHLDDGCRGWAEAVRAADQVLTDVDRALAARSGRVVAR